MKLGQVKTEGNFKLLVIGEPGAGKTVLAASFPGPLLYLDFDGKVDSAALFYKGNEEILNGVDVRDLTPKAGFDPIVELQKIYEKELIPGEQSGNFPFKTIVIDSISAFSTAALRHIIETNPGIQGVQTKQGKIPSPSHYGILLREFQKLIPSLLSAPCNVVMCAHTDTYKNETGVIIKAPMMDGSFSGKIAQYFKEIWNLHVDEKGRRIARTQAEPKFECLQTRIGAPALMDVSNGYKDIEKFLK